MEIERIPFKNGDLNGDSDHSSFGSQDSDDNAAMYKDKRKEDKKKDPRMSQQMHSVAKQFGSIGKTMGKKLKQLGKVSKADKQRRPSVGNEITQSTNLSQIALNHRDVVLVCNLSVKRSPTHQKMIKNYMDDANERFQHDKELKRKNDIELRNKVNNPRAVCITPGCSALGTAQNSYLCNSCYVKHQKEQAVQNRPGGQYTYNTFPGRARQTAGGNNFLGPAQVYHYGNSKFYTSSNENLNEAGRTKSNQASNTSQGLSQHQNVNVNRCPSPDYDNVDSGDNPNEMRNTSMSGQQQQASVVRHSDSKCRTSSCNFFGRSEWSGFCSRCWNETKSQTAAVRSSTRL